MNHSGWSRYAVSMVAVGILPWTGCGGAESAPKAETGVFPWVETTAEPQWVPLQPIAGELTEPDPREQRLAHVRRLTSVDGPARSAFHPDGRRIAFERYEPTGCAAIFVLDLQSGDEQRLTPPDAAHVELGGFDGERVVYIERDSCDITPNRASAQAAGTSWSMPSSALKAVDLSSRAVTTVVAERAYLESAYVTNDLTMYAGLDDDDVALFARERGDVAKWPTHKGYDGQITISPDGSRVAWTTHAKKDDDTHLAALRNKGGASFSTALAMSYGAGAPAAILTAPEARAMAPAFAPDSRHLLFALDHAAPPDATDLHLYLVDSDAAPAATGYPPLERVSFGGTHNANPTFSPDGRLVAFVSNRGGPQLGLYLARWIEP